MKIPRGIKIILRWVVTLYIYGFILYQITPFSYFETYIPEERLAPKPYVERIFYLFGVKSNEYPSKEVLEFLKSMDVDLVYGFFPFEDYGIFKNSLKAPECHLIYTSEISTFHRILNFLFDYVPKKITGNETRTFHYFIKPKLGKCNVIVQDVYLSPNFLDFKLDHSRNMVYKRLWEDLQLEQNVITNGRKSVDVYAYSTKSMYYPSESTIYPFKLYAKSNEEKTLIIVYRDGKVYRIYDERSTVLKINKPGKYSVKILTYAFSWEGYYFGLRTIAYSAPITLLY
ncbi:hypothetical protein [Aquifex aeolicus]|uniref:Uncharacterized protein aq_766 n=1 Tax=Aquifex aeolicus (strain VF5) TaxID=224324 RepID=Y766_AQUAE|nr:hypothetical protein [Aquifex aeolicus]O66966.1 RecName: Full=Uncharacterized protein aq_766 [Aquifex aeolicus VF5]AAC06927.1 putative protein [Aquifex aeolicus VF5]